MDCTDAAMHNVEKRITDRLPALQMNSLHLYSLKWPQERHRHVSWSMARRHAQNSLVSSASCNWDRNPSHMRNNLSRFIKCFTNKMSYILHRGSYNCILWVTDVLWFCIGLIAKPEGDLFSAKFVCLSVCLWPALLPFNVNRFWQNLVTSTLLWSSLAVTIMVQTDRRGTARCLFENFKKFWKITEFELQNSGPSFFASVSPVYCKKNSTRFEQNWRRR